VDEQSVFREGLAARLNMEKDFEAVTETADSSSMEKMIRRYNPDVLLYDIEEDAAQDFRMLKEIRRIFNTGLSVIAIPDIRSESAVRDFIRSGGSGYVLNTCPVEECIEAIRKAVRGKKYFSQELIEGIFSKKSVMKYNPEGQKIYDGYKLQRKKVLRLFMDGKSNKEIAACLGIGKSTVEYHMKWTRCDFNAHSDKELFQKLISLDIVWDSQETRGKGCYILPE
jgi:two-component system response regulator DesR